MTTGPDAEPERFDGIYGLLGHYEKEQLEIAAWELGQPLSSAPPPPTRRRAR